MKRRFDGEPPESDAAIFLHDFWKEVLVQNLVVWRAELQDGAVQIPRVVGGKDPDVAAPPGVLLPGVLDHL